METWHPLTRPGSLSLNAAISWRRLDIIATERGGLFDKEGIVQFTAHYRENGKASQQRETSRFQRVNGRWYYCGVAESSQHAL